jgi:hypothetical protein
MSVPEEATPGDVEGQYGTRLAALIAGAVVFAALIAGIFLFINFRNWRPSSH